MTEGVVLESGGVTAGGIVREIAHIDLERCSDPFFLRKALSQITGGLSLFFSDPEWPLVAEDPTTHELVLTALYNGGLALARLTELIDQTPPLLREHALNHRALRDPQAYFRSFFRDELVHQIIPFPDAQPGPPSARPPQIGRDEKRGTT